MSKSVFATAFRIQFPILLIISGLVGCSDSRETHFLAGCQKLDYSEDHCSCVYQVASSGLTDEQFELFSAEFLKDESGSAKAQAKLGIMSGVAAATKIAWVGANIEKACPR